MGSLMVEIMGAANKRGGLAGLGELAVYPQVARLQRQLDGVKAYYPDWTPGANIGEDGQYGRTTHRRLRSFIRFATSRSPVIAACAGTGTDELDRSGPATLAACLRGALFGAAEGLSDSQLSEIQQAWTEWKNAGASQENRTPVPTNPPGSDGSQTGTAAEEGWSTGEKVLFGLGLAGAAALILWLIFGDHDD